MKVICAGLPKTGTTSLAEALRVLGYNAYDFEEHASLHLDMWVNVIKRGTYKELDFTSMYRDVDAVLDTPPCLFVPELMEAFPDAKVILSMRDNEDKWVQSVRGHMTPTLTSLTGLKAHVFAIIPAYVISFLSPTMRKYTYDFRNVLRKDCFGTDDFSQVDQMKRKYRKHNEIIKMTVPEEKLLVFNMKQGWKPLCQFLGCNVPDRSFPHQNKGGAQLSEVLYKWSVGRKSLREAARNLLLIVCLALFLVIATMLILH